MIWISSCVSGFVRTSASWCGVATWGSHSAVLAAHPRFRLVSDRPNGHPHNRRKPVNLATHLGGPRPTFTNARNSVRRMSRTEGIV